MIGPLAVLAALGIGALALSDTKSPGSGAAPAGPGAGGPLSSTGDLGVENVGGVLRYRPDVANALLAGPFTKYSVTPGGVGQARTLVPVQGGLDNAAVWAFYQAVYGYTVLVSNDGRQPGQLWAVLPEQVPQLAAAASGTWAVLLAPSSGAPAVQQPNAMVPFSAPGAPPAPAGPPLPGQVPQLGQLGQFGGQVLGQLGQLGAALGLPAPQVPPQQAPQQGPASGADLPPGWATYPSQIDPATGAPRLADSAIPTFSAWLAQRTVAFDPADATGNTVLLAANAPQNGLAWALQRTGAGQYVLAPRTGPSVLRAATADAARNNAANWLIVFAPLGAPQQAPQPPQVPQQAPPQPQPYPVPQAPPAGPATPPFLPTVPQGSPIGQIGQQLGQVLGQFGIPIPGQVPPAAPQAPQQAPVPPAAGTTPTPNIDALPPDVRAKIAAASVAGDAVALEQMAAALASTSPGAATELRQLAIDAKLARRQRAALENRLVKIRTGDLASIWAQWYTGNASNAVPLLKYNGIGMVKVNGVSMPDPRRWKTGEDIELPPDWPGNKGLPPPAKGAARQATTGPLDAANAVLRRR